ncbi:MAG: alpha/beta fold hydrolase [Pseudomonadales bacterium]|nr:alpha/beta fold hydrolase [Pseudomonadales bacterium]
MSKVKANDIEIEYALKGAPEDDVIILVRGLGTQLVDWPENLINGLLDSDLQVLIFDNRDVGLSQKFDHIAPPKLGDVAKGITQPPYTLKDMSDDVIGLMDALNIEQAHVLGISMGGMIVQLMAVHYPRRLLSMLSIMSSSGRRGLPGPTPEAQAYLVAVPDQKDGEESVTASTAEWLSICGSPAHPETLEARLSIAKIRYQRDYNPDGVARQMAAIVHDGDRSERLQSIQVLTTIVHGVDDPLIPIACGEDTASQIPGSVFIAVDGMGHNFPEAMMPKIVDITTTHLGRLS